MREMKQTIAVVAMLVVSGLAASTMVGCTGGPRNKPIPTTEIDKGTGTLQGARKFLEGRWALTSFEVFPPNAEKIAVPGSGVMTYDDFGNLKMEIRMSDRRLFRSDKGGLVGAARIELATTCSQSRYATAALRPGGRIIAPGRVDRVVRVAGRNPRSPSLALFERATGSFVADLATDAV